MKPLVSASQLARLSDVASSTFSTEATIRRPNFGTADDDDALASLPIVGTVKGWLSSAPTAEGTVDSGSFVTANTYRWICPLGTDIQPRDVLDIGSQRYVVTDTTDGETLPMVLSVSLRLRE